jgi:hypothetical protein
MAALGAAAGAFEGDNAREEQRARRAGLGLQAASLAQQDRKFVDGQTLEREQMALEQQRFQANQDIKAQRTAIEQRNTDRSLTLDEKKFQADQESDLYQRGRNEKQDAWQQVLDEQEMQAKQLDMTFQKERLSQFKILADQEKQTMAERKRLSQTALASAMKIGMESGGVVPLSVVQAVAKETGIPFQGMYFAPDGSFVSDVLKDGKTVQEVTPANVQATIMRSMPGVFGEEAAKDLVNERRDKARYDSYLQREEVKSERTLDPKMKIRYMALNREHGMAFKELLGMYEADDPEAYKQKKDMIDRLENDMLALEGGVTAPKEKPGSKLGFVKGGGSGEVVERTLKNGQKALVRQLSNGKWEVVGGVPQEQAEPVMEEQPNKRSFRGVDGPRVTSSNGEVKSNFGPEPGTTEYWRDMPRGQATGMSKREIGFARRDILKRLESAHRKGPKSRDEAAKIKAELDAFNDKYPV